MSPSPHSVPSRMPSASGASISRFVNPTIVITEPGSRHRADLLTNGRRPDGVIPALFG